MITVFEPKKAIHVRLAENSSDFIVQDLETLDEKYVSTLDLLGICFKYKEEFYEKFLKVFDGKSDVLISSGARQRVEDILYFNCVDC